MPFAVEQIRTMREGAQAHRMRCKDERYSVGKFQNTPGVAYIGERTAGYTITGASGAALSGGVGGPGARRLDCAHGRP